MSGMYLGWNSAQKKKKKERKRKGLFRRILKADVEILRKFTASLILKLAQCPSTKSRIFSQVMDRAAD
jgi:IS5 family transposase